MTSTGDLTVLYSFGGYDALDPGGILQGTDLNFYGTTQNGGANDDGSVWKFVP
jgi:uncharacterized repeat protein (TIGR03803 family)